MAEGDSQVVFDFESTLTRHEFRRLSVDPQPGIEIVWWRSMPKMSSSRLCQSSEIGRKIHAISRDVRAGCENPARPRLSRKEFRQ